MSRILPTGDGTPYPANEFGRDGALVLQGTSGDAALAEANGRFQVLIQAGPLSADKRLRATNGNLRLAAVHLRSIIKAVGGKQAVSCDVIAESTAADVHVVHVDPDYDEGDPPLRPETIRTRHQAPFSRREFLRTATAAVAGVAVGGVTFLVSQQKSEAEGYISAYGEGESRIGPSLVPAVESSINTIRTYS